MHLLITFLLLILTLITIAETRWVLANAEAVKCAGWGDNSSYWMLAALTNGALPQPTIMPDPVTGQMVLTIDTLNGVCYQVKRSVNLIDWDFYEQSTGDGLPYEVTLPQDKTKEFFRFTVVEPPR